MQLLIADIVQISEHHYGLPGTQDMKLNTYHVVHPKRAVLHSGAVRFGRQFSKEH